MTVAAPSHRWRDLLLEATRGITIAVKWLHTRRRHAKRVYVFRLRRLSRKPSKPAPSRERVVGSGTLVVAL